MENNKDKKLTDFEILDQKIQKQFIEDELKEKEEEEQRLKDNENKGCNPLYLILLLIFSFLMLEESRNQKLK